MYYVAVGLLATVVLVCCRCCCIRMHLKSKSHDADVRDSPSECTEVDQKAKSDKDYLQPSASVELRTSMVVTQRKELGKNKGKHTYNYVPMEPSGSEWAAVQHKNGKTYYYNAR